MGRRKAVSASPRRHDEEGVGGEQDRVLDRRARERRAAHPGQGHRPVPAWYRRRRARAHARHPHGASESGRLKRGFAKRRRRRRLLAEREEEHVGPVREARGVHGAVATTHPKATEAALEMLQNGGNAFDAAISSALALCVCEPAANGIGGQTMLLFHDAELNRTVALDGSSRAPNHATTKTIPKKQRRRGYKATTVPSTPAVYAYMIDHYCDLDRATIMAPAIRLAARGYAVSHFQHAMQKAAKSDLDKGNAAPYFLAERGRRCHRPGETHRQPELADTLRHLSKEGLEDFYDGEVGRRIAEDMAKRGGLVTEEDLKQVPWPVEREIEWGTWNGHDIASFPPAGAGRVLLQILEVADRLDDAGRDLDSPRGATMFARNVQQALLDHREEPRDPARHAQMPTRMHGASRAQLLARRIQRGLGDQDPVGAEASPLTGETSHISVMDDEGNAVGLTQSIEEFYGACTVTPGLGFLYNNYIGAFDVEDASHPYYLRPNAVPWSSVAPAIMYRRQKPRLVIGSPGSDRIASAVSQVLIRMCQDEPMAAVDAPRLHATPEGRLHIEAERFDQEVLDALAADGFDVIERNPYALFHGSVQLVRREGRRRYHAVADPRRDGAAGGAG